MPLVGTLAQLVSAASTPQQQHRQAEKMKHSIVERIKTRLHPELDSATGVPAFFEYAPTQEVMNSSQKFFYQKWLKHWQRGNAIDIDEQFSYLFCYMISLVQRSDPKTIASDISDLLTAYPNVNKNSNNFVSFASAYVADAHVLQKEYDTAISVLAGIQLKVVEIHPIVRNKLLSIKLFVAEDLCGIDLLTLFGSPEWTRFGRENFFEMGDCLDGLIAERRTSSDRTFLVHMMEEYSFATLQDAYPLFGYHSDAKRYLDYLPYYYFHTTPKAYPFVTPLVREAENVLREKFGIPKIGEGWVSETELFYKLREAFPNRKIIQHASPKWLGRQHLDIYFPDLEVAVEYQGRQHDKPIGFFGGEEAFRRTLERDARKRRLCEQNGVTLLYVRPGYILDELVVQIHEVIK